ncbi:hypothetical protein TFUB4_02172 [Tannerella forsythia]|nr:hypothetical protein TFUB4_02172 [Tannerella forsythia]
MFVSCNFHLNMLCLAGRKKCLRKGGSHHQVFDRLMRIIALFYPPDRCYARQIDGYGHCQLLDMEL